LIFLELLEVLDLLKRYESIKEKTIHIVDQQVAELREVFFVPLAQLNECLTVLWIGENVFHDVG
jgi:hypothetical protein